MFKSLFAAFIRCVGKIRWEGLRLKIFGERFSLTYEDWGKIRLILEEQNCIILTRRKAHLSTYMCNLGHFLLTGRWGYWSHACTNKEDGDQIEIIESIGIGVVESPFEKVFDCDSVVLLRPVCGEGFDWASFVSSAFKDIGKKYDNDFNLKDDSTVSCVELIYSSLKKDPKFHERFNALEGIIKLEKNLTPDMFYECGGFEVVLEIRR